MRFPKFNFRSSVQFICLLFCVILVIELLVFNLLLFYAYRAVKETVEEFSNAEGGGLLDKLQANSMIRPLLEKAKYGGLASLIQETIDRIYMVPHPIMDTNVNGEMDPLSSRPCSSRLITFGIDVSHSGEALYIYERILMRKSFTFERLIIDIGANDGLLSSNSYNFIQWGWHAILVEPIGTQLDLAMQNTARYRDHYVGMSQRVTFVKGIIGTRNGKEPLVLSSDLAGMESHVLDAAANILDEGPITRVKSMTVKTFAAKYKVPKHFGILSLDAEGMGDKILHQWIDLKFRPAYIIYEKLHNIEPLDVTKVYLEKVNYRLLTKRGWNYIFEYQLEPDH